MKEPDVPRRKQRESLIQYISDENGNLTGVIVPIELWREIESEEETEYLLKNEAIKQPLLGDNEHQEETHLREIRDKLGI
ncbi:MAG: prevent-host-death protein [Candidatus Brocadiales bacterium]